MAASMPRFKFVIDTHGMKADDAAAAPLYTKLRRRGWRVPFLQDDRFGRLAVCE